MRAFNYIIRLYILCVLAVMYYNDIMSQKARTVVAKIRRQSRVRPYRERAEITPLLATVGTKSNGSGNGKSHGTTIHIDNQLYPIVEDFEGDLEICSYFINFYTYSK